jgi:tripartite-type tricarboxylate transporter receptor subunit TctC
VTDPTRAGAGNRRRALALLSAGVLSGIAAAIAPAAHAQAAWPTRPVTLIVPFGPGGTTDFLARTYAEKLQARLGQPVLVDYRPGANTLIGAKYVLAQPADGYTFFVAANPFAVGQLLFPKEFTYDPFRDFAPVSLLAVSPLILVANPTKLPVKDVRELVAYAKSHPGAINVPTTGVGAGDHLAGELLAYRAGVKMTFVPYKGGAAATQDVVSGVADLRIDSIPTSKPFIESGKLRVLGVLGSRTPLMPDVPAVSETVPGVQTEGFFSLVARAGVPQPVIERLARESDAILKSPDVVAKLQGMGLDPKPTTPQELVRRLKEDQDQWRTLLRTTGLKVE